MKVYVASYGYHHDSDYTVGVFSSKEEGEKYLKTNYKGFGDYQHVIEWELDVDE